MRLQLKPRRLSGQEVGGCKLALRKLDAPEPAPLCVFRSSARAFEDTSASDAPLGIVVRV